MATALSEFVDILVGGIVDLAEGIASGVSTMAQALFLEVDSTTHAVTGLSVFGGIVAIFAGLALARKPGGEYKSRKIGEGFNTNTEISLQIA